MFPKSKYVEILNANGVKGEVTDVDVRAPVGAAPNYASVIELVTVSFKDREPLHLFQKRVGSNDILASQQRISEALNGKEAAFLTKILPDIQEYVQKRTGLSDETVKGWFPRAYYGDKDLILMEDLTKRGFTGPSPPNHNFNTAKLVVEQLGKFHASSYGWLQNLKEPAKKLYPELYDILEQADMSEIFNVLLDASNNMVHQLMKTSSEPGAAEAALKLDQYSGRWYERWVKGFQRESVFEVISNGDCNQYNMMYAKEGDETKIVFVDYQMVRQASPNSDLSHYFCVALDTEAQGRTEDLLRLYFTSFEATLQTLSVPSPCTFEEFMADYKRKADTGFVFGLYSRNAATMLAGYDASANGGLNTEVMLKTLNEGFMTNKTAQAAAVKAAIPIVQQYCFPQE